MKKFMKKFKDRLPTIKQLLDWVYLILKIAKEAVELFGGSGDYIPNLKKPYNFLENNKSCQSLSKTMITTINEKESPFLHHQI